MAKFFRLEYGVKERYKDDKGFQKQRNKKIASVPYESLTEAIEAYNKTALEEERGAFVHVLEFLIPHGGDRRAPTGRYVVGKSRTTALLDS